MFKPIKHVFATFLRKLCKTDGCSQKEYGWKSEETHEPVMASFVLIAPSAVHMLRQRSERRILPWMEIPALQLWLQRDTSDGQARPSAQSLELAQTTMASHQKGGWENQTLLSEAAEMSVQTGRRGHGALWLPCHVNLHFIFLLNTHTHISTLMHTYTCLKISAQGSVHKSKINLNTPQIFCHFKKIV